jgi:hypothetical protein
MDRLSPTRFGRGALGRPARASDELRPERATNRGDAA